MIGCEDIYEIKKLISEAKTDEAIEVLILSKFSYSKYIEKQAFLISAEYKKLEDDQRIGRLSYNEYNINLARINSNLISLLNEIEADITKRVTAPNQSIMQYASLGEIINRDDSILYNINLLSENETFNLPKNRKTRYFPGFVSNLLDEFKESTSEFIGPLGKMLDDNRDLFNSVIIYIKTCLEYYYKGRVRKSYDYLSRSLYDIKDYLSVGKISMLHMHDQTSLYRMRVFNSKGNPDKNDIFHVPFEKREFLSSQRYSVPGFPCLYLGNSLFVCWKELDEPVLENTIIARFTLEEEKFKFMDLAYPTFLFKKLLMEDYGNPAISDVDINDTMFSFLIKWPIILCSSMNLNSISSSAPFKPEYIIPQMVLEWIRDSENLDGIIYFSNKVHFREDKTLGFYCNYAIPVRTSREEGQCASIANRVELTDPLKVQTLYYSNAMRELASHENYKPNIKFISLDDHTIEEYSTTMFGKLENYLSEKEHGKVEI